MIEIAPEEYWKKSTIHNIDLYLFVLTIDGKIGWRLPTSDEWIYYVYDASDPNHWMGNYWFSDELGYIEDQGEPELDIIPVRDLKDD
jgi:hypothetical protein